jgi:hypothetical protein
MARMVKVIELGCDRTDHGFESPTGFSTRGNNLFEFTIHVTALAA